MPFNSSDCIVDLESRPDKSCINNCGIPTPAFRKQSECKFGKLVTIRSQTTFQVRPFDWKIATESDSSKEGDLLLMRNCDISEASPAMRRCSKEGEGGISETVFLGRGDVLLVVDL
jgi:hypothetical protein